jgi:hypothetical protein
MNQETKNQQYGGVFCRYCRQPIPVPAIVVSMEAADERERSRSSREQIGRVFTLRCRACYNEFPYRSKEIVNFEGTPRTRISQSRHYRLLRQSGGVSRAANA